MGRLFALGVVFCLATLARLAAQEPPDKLLEGTWLGSLKLPVQEMRLAVKVTRKDQALKAVMDSLDQGAKDIPIDAVSLKDGVVKLELPKLKAEFEGKFNKEQTEIAGEWRQAGLKLPLILKKVDKLPAVKRPQEPKPPFPYESEEIRYENAKAKVKLAGTLTRPTGGGPFPAVLLITGSGPQNRNEEIFNHKPFWVLADHLTRRGVAVLRVDDRGVGGSSGSLTNATTADLAEDALAGVAYLKDRKDIDPRRIGLLGHSEGGLIAPIVAHQSKDVAFIVLLAGTGLPGDEILLLQGRAVLKAMGASETDLARQRAVQERIFAVLRKETDSAVIGKKAQEIIAEELAKLPEEQQKQAKAMAGAMQAQLKMIESPWLRYFLTYDPRPALGKVHCPVLALIGEKDLQVPPKENLPEIEKALKTGGNKDFTVKELPGLNHLFQSCKTGAISEYGQIEETFAPSALELIGDWIVKRTTLKTNE